jgi:hypothetical protein
MQELEGWRGAPIRGLMLMDHRGFWRVADPVLASPTALYNRHLAAREGFTVFALPGGAAGPYSTPARNPPLGSPWRAPQSLSRPPSYPPARPPYPTHSSRAAPCPAGLKGFSQLGSPPSISAHHPALGPPAPRHSGKVPAAPPAPHPALNEGGALSTPPPHPPVSSIGRTRPPPAALATF